MPICEHWTLGRFSEYAIYCDYDNLRKDTVSNGINTVLKPIEYGQIRIPLRIFHPCLIFDNYQNLAADLPGPVNHIQVRTLRIRYESLRIGQTDTEALSAASAAYVSASVT